MTKLITLIAIVTCLSGCSTLDSDIEHHPRESAADANALIIQAGKIKYKFTKLDVILDVDNRTAGDLDLTKTVWRANYTGAEGSINETSLAPVVGSKQKLHGYIVFGFGKTIANQGILKLTASNILTLEGKKLPPVSLKYEAYLGGDSTFPQWRPLD